MSGEPIATSTDVYSLGVLLYTLLCGRYPFDDTVLSPLELMKAVVDTDPPRPSDVVTLGNDRDANAARRGSTAGKLRRDLRGDLDIIVRRAMKKTPGERYRSVDAFADDLRRYLNHEPILARGDSALYRVVKLVQRNPALSAVSALAIVATMTALGVALWQANEARHQRDRALNLLARSDALTEFFEFLLNDAGPPDQPLTIDAMLTRSDSLLDSEFGGNPEHQAAILGVQGAYYATLGEAADAQKRLERAQASPPAAATSICARASTASTATCSRSSARWTRVSREIRARAVGPGAVAAAGREMQREPRLHRAEPDRRRRRRSLSRARRTRSPAPTGRIRVSKRRFSPTAASRSACSDASTKRTASIRRRWRS